MRSLNRMEMSLALLAMYVWLWIDLVVRLYRWLAGLPEDLRDFAATVRENDRGLRRGAADIDWQETLHRMAAPVRVRRIIEESGEGIVPKVETEVLAEWRPESDIIEMYTKAPAWAIEAYGPRPSLAGPTGVADIAPLVAFDGVYPDGPVVVVTEAGEVVDTTPKPVAHKRRHRSFIVDGPHPVAAKRPRRVQGGVKRALLASGAPEVLRVERAVRARLDGVVDEVLRKLVGDEEAREILGLWSYA